MRIYVGYCAMFGARCMLDGGGFVLARQKRIDREIRAAAGIVRYFRRAESLPCGDEENPVIEVGSQ